jgi:hypothetical protein
MMTMPPFQAFTIQDVPILSVHLNTRQQAIWWAENQGERYGCSYVVQHTATGPRKIWKAERQAVAA